MDAEDIISPANPAPDTGTIAELNQKIDLLATQVAYLAEQARLADVERQARAELISDLTPIAGQAFNMAIEQLEEVQEFIDLGDLLRLVKRLARNQRNIEKLLDQLESLSDLFQTVGPLSDEVFAKLIDSMALWEQKGYFAFARSGVRVVDNIVTGFSEQDIDRLGDNVVLILNTIKDMTQPEIMNFIHDTLLVAEREIDQPVDISYRGLLRQLRDPDLRRGLALTMRVLKVIGGPPASAPGLAINHI